MLNLATLALIVLFGWGLYTTALAGVDSRNAAVEKLAADYQKNDSQAPVLEMPALDEDTVLFMGLESMGIGLLAGWLMLSHFNALSIQEVFKNGRALHAAASMGLACCVCLAAFDAGIDYSERTFEENGRFLSVTRRGKVVPGKDVKFSAAKTVDKEAGLEESYKAADAGQSVLLIKKGGEVYASGLFEKTGSSLDNPKKSAEEGWNAVVRMEDGTADFEDAPLTSQAEGAYVFYAGGSAQASISASTLKNLGSEAAGGLSLAGKADVSLSSSSLSCVGKHSPAIAVYGGSLSSVANTLNAGPQSSPLFLVHGDVRSESDSGSTESQGAVLHGGGSLELYSTSLAAWGQGEYRDSDEGCILILNEGHDREKKAAFTGYGADLSIRKKSPVYDKAPLFHVTNATADILLTGCSLQTGSGILLKADATSRYGAAGKNGGIVNLTASNQELTGDILADFSSTVNLSLQSSSYLGAVNERDQSDHVKVSLDAGSYWQLTGDSYISELENDDPNGWNIILNGHKLFVGGKEYK